MSNDHPRIQKELLLTRMAADRQELRSSEPPKSASDVRLSPELKSWLVPGGLFLISMLRLPGFIKAPLRAFAVLSMKRKVTDVIQLAQSGARGTSAGTAVRPSERRDIPAVPPQTATARRPR